MNKIREYRRKMNMSQSEFGTIFGVTGQTILNWESEIHSPSINQIRQMVAIFDISADELLGLPIRNETLRHIKEFCRALYNSNNEELTQMIEELVSRNEEHNNKKKTETKKVS